MIAEDRDEKITLTMLLGKVWPQFAFMAKLVKRTLVNLQKFIDQADNFINEEDTLNALTELRRKELKRVDRKGKTSAKGPTRAKAKRKLIELRKEEPSSRYAGYRQDRSMFSIQWDESQPAQEDNQPTCHYCTYHQLTTHNTGECRSPLRKAGRIN